MITKATMALVTVALVQAPVRLVTEALLLRHMRRSYPEMFDGHRCAAIIAACIEDYRGHL